MKRVIMGLVLGVAGLIAFANTAAACTYECVVVAPNCRRCVDLQVFTNKTCRNTSGPCGCFYTNECTALTIAESIGVASMDEAPACSASSTDVAASAELVSVEQ
jgi:hypothetical protein